MSGSGGTGGLPADCTGDTECDDKDMCNGKETCNNGKCQNGTPPQCTNPDGVHCSAACEPSTGDCIIKGLDADSDQHLDAKCTAATTPGDDCDDTNDKVYTGADEVCDGIDNDCNGKDELEEGTPMLGGVSDLVEGQFPAIAWSPTDKHYGVVWLDPFGDGINYARIDQNGQLDTSSRKQVTKQTSRPRIAWSGTEFGVSWIDNGQVMFRRVLPDGTFPDVAKVVSESFSAAPDTSADLAGTSSGWIVAWSDITSNPWGRIRVRAISATGTPQDFDHEVGDTGGSNREPAISSGFAGVLVARERGALQFSTSIKAFRLSSALATVGDAAVSADPLPNAAQGIHPAASATAQGWALAWTESSTSAESISYVELLASGAKACTASALPSNKPAVVGAVASRGEARLVVYGQNSNQNATVHAVSFDAKCQVRSQAKLADIDNPGWIDFGVPVAAWGDLGTAILWVDETSGLTMVRSWISGPNLCDNPVP
ncbi:MAG: putative metal-binding motif-containing protein [Myxococcales bacterium]|nr:putative metal-binding motif-containing protein [Myxococcales bacterium]MCB9580114.1 putative metal-binding motif-containing protein [Polyangiaceae bacterium]